jgi:hypothetical protein
VALHNIYLTFNTDWAHFLIDPNDEAVWAFAPEESGGGPWLFNSLTANPNIAIDGKLVNFSQIAEESRTFTSTIQIRTTKTTVTLNCSKGAIGSIAISSVVGDPTYTETIVEQAIDVVLRLPASVVVTA